MFSSKCQGGRYQVLSLDWLILLLFSSLGRNVKEGDSLNTRFCLFFRFRAAGPRSRDNTVVLTIVSLKYTVQGLLDRTTADEQDEEAMDMTVINGMRMSKYDIRALKVGLKVTPEMLHELTEFNKNYVGENSVFPVKNGAAHTRAVQR